MLPGAGCLLLGGLPARHQQSCSESGPGHVPAELPACLVTPGRPALLFPALFICLAPPGSACRYDERLIDLQQQRDELQRERSDLMRKLEALQHASGALAGWQQPGRERGSAAAWRGTVVCVLRCWLRCVSDL